MGWRSFRGFLSLLLAGAGFLVTLLVLAPARPAAAASGITSGGSIVYVKDRNLWLTSPDGATQRQITTDGAVQSPDGTGSDGYTSPSQSNSGDVVVAVRNEGRTGDLFRKDGYLWVMNRRGEVIRKFMPPQGIRFGNTVCGDSVVVAPRGIIGAVVSPDGSKVAYVSQWNFHYCWGVVEHTQLWVVGIDGSNGTEITSDGTGDLGGPSWASNSRLVLSDPSNSTYFVDLPGTLATRWGTLGEEPDLRAGKLASQGWSASSDYRIYLWTSSGPPAAPAFRCSYGGAAGGSDSRFRRPSWAPDGGALVWAEGDGSMDEPGEGVWVMAVGDLAVGCPAETARQVLIAGGSEPHWGPAGMGSVPTISVTDARVTEGDAGTVMANFVVSLSAASTGSVTASYATADRTALAGPDYVTTSGTLTFTPGQTTQKVSVPINGDTLFEVHEKLALELTGIVGATPGDPVAVGTIVNNDAQPSITITDVSRSEPDSGPTTFSFSVKLSAASGAKTVATFATADGTATAGSDYVARTGTVAIPAGQLSKTITVTVNGDLAAEANETFLVNLANPKNAIIADAQGQGTIVNDD